MSSSLNVSTFARRVKARILTLSVVLVISVDSSSLTPFGLPRGFLLSAAFRVP